MEIILFHEYHSGDIFFSTEIIRNIINCNPNLKVSIMNTENGYYFYNNITNLNFITPQNYNKNSIAWEKIDETIYINLWCAGGGLLCKCDDLIEQQDRIIEIISKINLNHNEINIQYNPLTITELIPKLDKPIIPESIQNKINNNKFIFYYNVFPRSGQYGDLLIKKKIHNGNIIKLFRQGRYY